MALDVKALLNNRKVQIGAVGVAGVAGVATYLHRKNAAASSSSSAPAATGDGSSSGTVAGGFPDTSGTDSYGALGQLFDSENTQLQTYINQLTNLQNSLGNVTPVHGGGTGTPPVVTPPPKPPPPKPPAPKPPTGSLYVTVLPFTSHDPPWQSTLSGIAGHYHTTVARLLQLNPDIHNPNVIRSGSRVRYQ